ncbi:MAG: hypothetical protein Q7W30_03720 [Coriobacteriia bacterium]|nr:hypothetical protein [Coriobacteriia bacterium]
MNDEPLSPDEPVVDVPGPARGWRLARRILAVTGAVLLVLAAVALLLYNYGSMEAPGPQVRAAYAQALAAGQAPPVEQAFHIPIPGCRCHSADPVQQMLHEARPLKDCMTCH